MQLTVRIIAKHVYYYRQFKWTVDVDWVLNVFVNANFTRLKLFILQSNKVLIVQLANFVAKAWETNPEQEKIEELAKLMTNLMDTTLLCPEKPFDEALKQFCRNNIPTHSVSPSITLLIAIGYIERLKKVMRAWIIFISIYSYMI